MADKSESVRDNYTENLKAESYYKFSMDYFNSQRTMNMFIMQSVHDIIKSGRFSGTKLLELGSAVTVHNIALPSAQFTSIVQSDLVPDNCRELRRWHEGKSTLDWSPILEAAAEIAEYSDLQKGRAELESRIRRSVKHVVIGDVLSNPVLSEEELTTADTRPPYDLILSNLTLLAAPADLDAFRQILRRLRGLLRVGGGLVFCDFEDGDIWQVDGVTYNYLKLSIPQVEEMLREAGFGNLELKILKREELPDFYDCNCMFCVAAEKL